jgi:hypothetical protein
MLAQRRESPARPVTTHRTQVFALQPDIGIIQLAQVIIPLQRRFQEEFAKGTGGSAGSISELGHWGAIPAPHRAGKDQ